MYQLDITTPSAKIINCLHEVCFCKYSYKHLPFYTHLLATIALLTSAHTLFSRWTWRRCEQETSDSKSSRESVLNLDLIYFQSPTMLCYNWQSVYLEYLFCSVTIALLEKVCLWILHQRLSVIGHISVKSQKESNACFHLIYRLV